VRRELRGSLLCILEFASILLLATRSEALVIRLHVDLTDAPRNIYHAHLQMPVHPGEVSLVFPKWIPGNHRPSGPIGAVTGIRMEAAGTPLAWERDPIDMYEFHVTVPAGVDKIDVFLDAITSQDSAGAGGPAASSNILDLNWNAVLLYPKGSRSDDVTLPPRLRCLLDGSSGQLWKWRAPTEMMLNSRRCLLPRWSTRPSLRECTTRRSS